jgi:hypothetical protein
LGSELSAADRDAEITFMSKLMISVGQRYGMLLKDL